MGSTDGPRGRRPVTAEIPDICAYLMTIKISVLHVVISLTDLRIFKKGIALTMITVDMRHLPAVYICLSKAPRTLGNTEYRFRLQIKAWQYISFIFRGLCILSDTIHFSGNTIKSEDFFLGHKYVFCRYFRHV